MCFCMKRVSNGLISFSVGLRRAVLCAGGTRWTLQNVTVDVKAGNCGGGMRSQGYDWVTYITRYYSR